MKFQDLGNPETRIETSEQAIRRVEELCRQVVRCRQECDVVIPDDPQTTATLQQKAYGKWLMTYGQAIGTVIAYYQCGRLQDEAYRRLKARVQATLTVSTVGVATGRSSGNVQVVSRVPGLGS